MTSGLRRRAAAPMSLHGKRHRRLTYELVEKALSRLNEPWWRRRFRLRPLSVTTLFSRFLGARKPVLCMQRGVDANLRNRAKAAVQWEVQGLHQDVQSLPAVDLADPRLQGVGI